MASLKYFPGAIPGKKRKLTNEEKSKMKKEYEKHRPVRTFNTKWTKDREWLQFNEERQCMTCKFFVSMYGETSSDTFVQGCTNLRTSSIADHEKSKSHIKAQLHVKTKTPEEIMKTQAGKTLTNLKSAERSRLIYLFRNAHAIAKNNRPLSDFTWLCEIDKAKQLDIGTTYINDQAAFEFIRSIAMTEKAVTARLLNKNPFFAFMMDGSTGISGDEQEAIFIRTAAKGVVAERFLNIGIPNSTKSQDLFEHTMAVFKDNNIDTSKLIAMASDGASNMTGARSGLSTLMRQKVNTELVNVNCLCHRLELAFRDVLKKVKLYDKLMTLLIGLYYFYKKSYTNKHGLKLSIQAMGHGVFPTKVTGTRWLPHLYRALCAFLKTYNALEAHLSTISHDNPKGEGLLKLMLNKQLMAFILFLHDALVPAIRLSLKLQKPEVTLSDSMCWVDSSIELLSDKEDKICEAVNQLLETGLYAGISLKGNTPDMKYTQSILQGFCDAIQQRFQVESKNAMNATKILNIGTWPATGSSELKEFGNEEVKIIYQHFQTSLTRVIPDMSADSVEQEWSLLKKLVSRKYKDNTGLTWETIFKETTDLDQIMLLVDLALTIPSTSVTCETTFSQLKLMKTCRRSRLGATVVNDLMIVKLESPEIASFNPESTIDTWLGESVMGRRPTYTRRQKTKTADFQEDPEEHVIMLSDTEEAAEGPATATTEADTEEADETIQTVSYSSLETDVNALCDKDGDDFDAEEECFDFQDELLNYEKLIMFSRE